MLAIPPFWASSKNALLRANTKPPVELVVADLEIQQIKGGKTYESKESDCRG